MACGSAGRVSCRSGEHTSEIQSLKHLACRLFFFNDAATTEIYTLSLHDALPICSCRCRFRSESRLRIRSWLADRRSGCPVSWPAVVGERPGGGRERGGGGKRGE